MDGSNWEFHSSSQIQTSLIIYSFSSSITICKCYWTWDKTCNNSNSTSCDKETTSCDSKRARRTERGSCETEEDGRRNSLLSETEHSKSSEDEGSFRSSEIETERTERKEETEGENEEEVLRSVYVLYHRIDLFILFVILSTDDVAKNEDDEYPRIHTFPWNKWIIHSFLNMSDLQVLLIVMVITV